MTKRDLEESLSFQPRFDEQGLIPAIVTDAHSGHVLMFAYMNETALALTLRTKEAHFWSRSRNSLWRKGETSGDMLDVCDIRVDCDQDVVWLKAKRRGKAACHTGRVSCFYRRVELDQTGTPQLTFVEDKS